MFGVVTEIPGDFKVDVKTTMNRGHTPAEVAKMCADKLVSVSENAPPPIRDQAKSFKHDITSVVEFYMIQAIRSYKTTLYGELKEAGQEELARVLFKGDL
jgi:hypothetical protein|tara:strand:- start:1280 stop:1579 length:300 start_codon:yes stop_codon:yes gene_type:complete